MRASSGRGTRVRCAPAAARQPLPLLLLGLLLCAFALRSGRATCQPGEVRPDASSTGCASCDAGKFSTSTNVAFCAQCAAGKEQARPAMWRPASPNRPTLRASTASCEIHGGC